MIGRAATAPRPRVSPSAADAGVLYERYYDRVYGYCLYQLGSREEAEDAAQTTFMWACRGLRRGVVPRAEASWLFTIAQNACRARHRARGRRRGREVLSDPQVLADLTAAPAADHDDLLGLEDALARMPELQRRAILLREWRGLSYREIAEELDLSGAAVETLIFRARRSLAALLAGQPAPKRARRLALDLSSIAAAVKSFLGAGTAAKLAAGAAAIVAATTLAGSTERRNEPAQVLEPASRAGVLPADIPFYPSAAPQAGAKKPSTPHPAKAKAKHEGRPAAETTDPVLSEPAPTPAQPVEDVLDPLPVVADLTDAVPLDSTVDAVDETLGPVAGLLPPLAETLT